MTPIHGASCQSWSTLYPDDLHFSSSSWGRHSGVINSHAHAHTQTAGSARQWLAHWLSRQARSSVASCHGGGCLELQPRSWRWGEEGCTREVGGGHPSSLMQCTAMAFKGECLQKATKPGDLVRRLHRKTVRYRMPQCFPKDNEQSEGPGSSMENHSTEVVCWHTLSPIKY